MCVAFANKCKSYSYFFSKNISVYAIFNDQSFNDTLTNNIVSFEQLGPEVHWLGSSNKYPQHMLFCGKMKNILYRYRLIDGAMYP